MENDKDWKLKLRYGKIKTPYQHFTAIAQGVVVTSDNSLQCPAGPAMITIRTWATDAAQSAQIIQFFGSELGYEITEDIQIYETDPERPPKDQPYGYGINVTPFENDLT